jgi:hypothetical protein
MAQFKKTVDNVRPFLNNQVSSKKRSLKKKRSSGIEIEKNS